MKVYCDKCRYNQRRTICNAPQNYKRQLWCSDYYSEELRVMRAEHPCTINRKNDCGWFE